LRYFFHFISQGNVFEDKKGEFFANLGEALDEAFALADEMAGDAPSHDRAVLIADERGKEIARLVIGNPGSIAECNAEYRGYRVQAEGAAGSWLVQVTPIRPDQPTLSKPDRHINARSGQEALAEACQWIDELLRD
jgi:Domain of unknown function (DUF6894)